MQLLNIGNWKHREGIITVMSLAKTLLTKLQKNTKNKRTNKKLKIKIT